VRPPRLGPTASALHCRIGPTMNNCYWENAEKNLQRQAGTREGAPCGPPGGGAGIKGRDRASAGAVSPYRTGLSEPPPVTDVRQVHCLLQRPLPGRTASAGTREEGPPGSRYWAISRRAGS
jgi:hypothetical protein